jgi:general secretion pathway protein L
LKSIGIDIGSSSIKIAELEVSGKSLIVQKIQSYPLTSKTESDRELEIITTLKDAITFFDTDEKTKFVIGLPQDKASLRRLSFPFKEKFKIIKSLPFEMEDLTPFSLEDSIYEAKILKKQGLVTEVLAIALPKEIISKTINTANDCGIDPDILSLEGLALNNLFEDIFEAPKNVSTSEDLAEFDDEDEEDESESTKKLTIKEPKEFIHGEGVLNLGHDSSLLIVRADRQLQAVRRINWGSKDIIQNLAYEFNIQPKEADAMLKASKGVLLRSQGADPKDQKVSEVISKSLEKMAQRIHLTLLEIKGSHQVKVDGLGLLGGLSLVHNLGPRLTQYLQVPCNRILKIKHHPEISLESTIDFMGCIAIGLAMEAAKRPTQPAVNFRRDEFSKGGSQFKKLWRDWNFHIKLASASLILFFFYAQIRTTLSEDLALTARRSMKDTAEKVLRIKKSQASERKLRTLLKDLEKREELKVKVNSHTKNAPSPLKLLKSISEKAPSRRQFPVDIKSLEIEATRVEMIGLTKAKNEIQRFARSLESLSQGPVKQQTKEIRKGNERFVEFNISFTPKKGVM